MANPNYQDSQSKSKGIFLNTIELIGSVLLFALFITIAYGVFMGKMEDLLWSLFYWLVDILKPILAIAGLFIGIFRGLPLVVSFIESILEERRIEKAEIDLWQNLERKNSPTPLQDATKNTLEGESKPVSEESTESRGEVEIVWESNGSGAIAHHLVKGSKEWRAQLEKNAEIEKELREKQLQEAANEKLKEVQPRMMSKPNNIKENWRVTKTCLRLGSKIIGKCMMGSTSNALSKGGQNYKDMFEDSSVSTRNANGQTKSGLYSLFIPMEWNMEGFIDIYGMPVFRKPLEPIRGVDGGMITNGAIDYWEAEVDSLKNDADALNEYYRQFPRTTSHAFRDESKQALYNLTKIYQQIDYNDSMIKEHYITRGMFSWQDGIKDTKVIFTPDSRGRFYISWTPQKHIQNNVHIRNGLKYPGNEHIGSFGCDSYDISAVVGGRGSNGSLHGLTKYHMDEAPVNEFFLEYIARPQTAEIFFEEVLMACIFYGMPILIENNKPRLLYHFKNRGYRHFCLNRPDKQYNKLTKTERELGGIPNSSEDIKQAHASAIQSYIERYVGFDLAGDYRDPEEMGTMPFIRTLEDWAKFDINDRTKFDASISSGLAIMANQKHLYVPEKKESKININFARYSNDGTYSQLIK